MANTFEAKRIINGKWGEVWLDDEKVGECFGLQAKVNFKKEDVVMCGQMGNDKKVTGWDGTGSLKMHKVSSRMAKQARSLMVHGKDVRFTIISKLADPDVNGTERISISGVSFDDVTLADWEAGNLGTIEAPFTFTGVDYLDEI